MKQIIVRLQYAALLCSNKRTLEFGGAKAVTDSYDSLEPPRSEANPN